MFCGRAINYLSEERQRCKPASGICVVTRQTKRQWVSCSRSSGPLCQPAWRGYHIRILKCGERPGDKAPMAYVELVDRPQLDAADHDDEAKGLQI